MNKHTPGPWIRDPEGGLKGDVRGANGRWVALCWGIGSTKNPYRDEYRAECDSNARLIAAAPELLESLELAIDGDGGTHYDGEDDEVGERSCCGEVSYKPHRPDCWVVTARAVIAKAKGQTP